LCPLPDGRKFQSEARKLMATIMPNRSPARHLPGNDRSIDRKWPLVQRYFLRTRALAVEIVALLFSLVLILFLVNAMAAVPE